ncbi:MAG: multicopper oxidase domain-containing protein [Geobacteraceae bacterium]|nr:multicopper oxidase domain-containing protein [Geobacteraceae bacterium]
MPVVNGVTYATYTVEPTVYRIRLIGGTDSRAWIAQLVKGNPTPSMVDCGGIDPDTLVAGAPNGCAVYPATSIIPFYQVGTEQGLLPTMVKRTEIDIMGGERIDVLVDFSGVAGQTVTMKNLGDDAPYSGRFDFDNIDIRQPTSLNIPEIMKFVVNKKPLAPALPVVSAQTPADGIVLKAAPFLGTPTVTRTIALIEITDQYGRTMPTVDARGYVPPGIRTTEVMQAGDTEYWDIVNTTVDAHPMHIHQVPFLPIYRQAIALDANSVPLASGFKAAYNSGLVYDVTEHDKTDAARSKYVFTPSQYVVDPASSPIPVERYDAGWKDTINTPPGYVVRNKIMFDILGDYVWHCHILSHEEHDMMRPFRVTNKNPLTAPTAVLVGAVANGMVSVEVQPAQAAPIQHVVQMRKVGTPFWSTSFASTSLQSVNVDAVGGPGEYEFRAQFVEPAIQNVHVLTAPESAWTPGNVTAAYNGVLITTPAQLPEYILGSGAFTPIAFNATGGIAPYTWAVTGGALPPGLTLDPGTVVPPVNGGLLSGTPNQAGVYTFTLTASDFPDAVSPTPITDSKTFTMTVSTIQALTITPATGPLPAATVGTPASFTFNATGGIPPYVSWTQGVATVPGLNLVGNVLSGTPTTLGTNFFTITVTDSSVPPLTQTAIYTLAVNAAAAPPVALSASPASPVSYTLGSGAFAGVTFSATGGNGTYTWSSTGTIPTGTTLVNGVLSGTPTVAATYNFSVTATSGVDSATVPFTVVVNPAAGPVPATSASLIPRVPSPQPINTSVIFDALALGGDAGPYIYQFRYRIAVAGTAYTMGQPYSASTSYTWDTAALALPAGTYNILVEVRRASTNVLETSKVISYTITP